MTADQAVDLRPVDAAEVTLVMDNSIDILMPSEPGVQRVKLAYDWSDHDALVAEHGFSALVTVEQAGGRSSVLYDGGLSATGLQHNLDVLQIDVSSLRAIAISHGHMDHHGGLEGVFRTHRRTRLPLVIHPDAWKDRKVALPTGAELHFPPPSFSDLEREQLTIVEERGPSLLVDGTLLVSGQVKRTTSYETGFGAHFARDGHAWEPDPWIWDDQNVVVNVRDRGLVVVSGCSHAGAVNVIRNAQRLTGEQRIAGFVGGLHLTGGVFGQIIPPTVADLVDLRVERLVPAHCTGWRATHALARALPDAYVQPSVGTTMRFERPP